MKPDEIWKRTRRTAEAIGILVGGLVVVWFCLLVGGVFEDTWFDLPGVDEPEQSENVETNEVAGSE